MAQVPSENSSASQSCAVVSTISSPGCNSSSDALQSRAVLEVDVGGVDPEPDQQLRAVGQQPVDHEIAEWVTRRDRVDAAALTLDPQPELDAPGRLAERDGIALGRRQVIEANVRQHVERHRQHARARAQDIAVARAHLDAVADRPERIHRRGEPLRERRLRSHRVDQAARSRPERVAAARILGQLEASARERVQAQDADRSGVVQESVGDALELGRQHVALLRVEAELVHALLDRLQVERRQRVDREERIVRTRQRRGRRLDEAVCRRAA